MPGQSAWLLALACKVMIAAVPASLAAQATIGDTQLANLSAPPEWQKAAGGNLEFEVASVRPSAPGTPYSASISLDGLDGPPPAGSLFSANAPLHAYLLFAYKISDSGQARAIFDNLPSWAKPPQFFNIGARAEGTPTRDQLRLMVQALLADRFKLVLHRETQMREQHILVLERPGKPGPQLHVHPADQPCINHSGPVQLPSAPVDGSEAAKACGIATWFVEGQQHIRLTEVTMDQAARLLSNASMAAGSMTPHTGVDGTGLTGRFDLDLQFLPETNGPGSNPDGSGPPFAAALRSQLGLKLVEQKRPVETIVIDHLQKPSAN